jgi:hypothetical protein
MTTKPRPDGCLKTLPQERQDEIADYATDHTITQTVTWLAAEGIQTSRTAVCRFLSWYRMREQLDTNRVVAAELVAERSEKDPTLTPEKLDELGHTFFAGMAIEQRDPRTWYMIQQITLRKSELEFEIQKYKDLLQAQREAIARSLKAAEASGGISPETVKKIEADLGLG